MHASHWVVNRPKGAMKVKGGSPSSALGSGGLGRRRTNGSSVPPRRPGEARACTLRPERW
jgi:hypothetical protein